jgi:hypothetical protein
VKSLLRRIVKLEQHAETMPIELPPLPPPGASKEELDRALEEAWRQFQAHPTQQVWFIRMVEIAQRSGITSKEGAESFFPSQEEYLAFSSTGKTDTLTQLPTDGQARLGGNRDHKE